MFARQMLVATGEKFLRRAQVYTGWFLFGLLLPLVAVWRQLLTMSAGGTNYTTHLAPRDICFLRVQLCWMRPIAGDMYSCVVAELLVRIRRVNPVVGGSCECRFGYRWRGGIVLRGERSDDQPFRGAPPRGRCAVPVQRYRLPPRRW